MFWADKIAAGIAEKADGSAIIVNDSKTPSGRVHVGSLRGVVIHDVIYRALKQAGKSVKFLYGTDDYDALDTVPHYLPQETFAPYLGWPLCNVPSPNPDAAGDLASDYAKYFMGEFLEVFDYLGVKPEVYYLRDFYRSGQLNAAIDLFLNNAQKVRQAYKEASKADRPDNWYPFQVICENCGKIATTQVTDYQNGQVFYTCSPTATNYVEGCGHSGWVSPLDGRGKLPWKVEWVAKWQLLGVDVELAGKDHSQKGGSRDVADAICRKVLGQKPPFHSPYEFILVNGTKMSSSKGVGSSAKDMAALLPPELLRFLMLRTPPKTVINFSPNYETVTRLFRDYDGLIAQYRAAASNSETAPDLEEEWMPLLYSQLQTAIAPYQPFDYSTIVSLLQIPHLDLEAEIAQRAAEPLSDRDWAIARERITSAQTWLDNYADAEEKLVLYLDRLPDRATDLTPEQVSYLVALQGHLSALSHWDGEGLQTALFSVAKELGIKIPLAFQAIYLIFLNQERGPKAGPLLSYCDREFVLGRIAEAIALAPNLTEELV